MGPLVHWSIGPLVLWSISPLVHWSICPLVRWSIGPLVECRMLNVIKVKLLSERTSGVPPVILYLYIRPLFQIFTQSIDAIDVTTVTLSRLNSIYAIDVTRYLGDIFGIFW